MAAWQLKNAETKGTRNSAAVALAAAQLRVGLDSHCDGTRAFNLGLQHYYSGYGLLLVTFACVALLARPVTLSAAWFGGGNLPALRGEGLPHEPTSRGRGLSGAGGGGSNGSNGSGKMWLSGYHTFRLNGEPKSGTTWMEFIVGSMLKHRCTGGPSCDLSTQDRDIHIQVDGRDAVFFTRSGKHKIPTMDHRGGFDLRLREPLSNEKIEKDAQWYIDSMLKNGTLQSWLVIVRDPRAVLVSSCHYQRYKDCDWYARKNINASIRWIDTRYRFFRAVEKLSGGAMAKLIFYEKLKADFKGAIQDLSSYMFGSGSPLTDTALDAIQKETSLGSMAAMEAHGKLPKHGANRVRKGSACGFMDELDKKTLQQVTEVMRLNLSPELNHMWQC